jgi:hypothetical protein
MQHSWIIQDMKQKYHWVIPLKTTLRNSLSDKTSQIMFMTTFF